MLDCAPIPGSEALLQHAQPMIVWVGEMHGTAEQPAIFTDLVCAMSKPSPVRVVLEHPLPEQPAWTAFLASDGGPQAKAAFLASRLSWTSRGQDGRSSQAMFALAETLRVLVHSGRVTEVDMMMPLGGGTESAYEEKMAQNVLAAFDAAPRQTVLVLSGNAHARPGEFTFHGETYKEAAWHIPRTDLIALNTVSHPGEAWNCQQKTCGPHPYDLPDAHPRGLILQKSGDYDGVLYTGAPSTASPPAALPPTPIDISSLVIRSPAPATPPAKPTSAR